MGCIAFNDFKVRSWDVTKFGRHMMCRFEGYGTFLYVCLNVVWFDMLPAHFATMFYHFVVYGISMHATDGFRFHDDLDNSSAPDLGTDSALSNSNRLKRLMSLVKVLIFPPLIIYTFRERICPSPFLPSITFPTLQIW